MKSLQESFAQRFAPAPGRRIRVIRHLHLHLRAFVQLWERHC